MNYIDGGFFDKCLVVIEVIVFRLSLGFFQNVVDFFTEVILS